MVRDAPLWGRRTAVEGWLQDLRQAAHSLVRSPGAAVTATVTLAFGLGSCIALLALVHSALYRHLPYGEPDRIAIAWSKNLKTGWTEVPVSLPVLEQWRSGARSFDQLSGFTWTDYRVFTVGGERNEPERVPGIAVMPDLFTLLRVTPRLGRAFRAEDGTAGAAPVVLLGHRLWTRKYAADPAIVGRTIRINREDHLVTGVLGSDFELPVLKTPQLFIPLNATSAELRNPENRVLVVVGRLKPGIGVSGAQADLARLSTQLAAADPAQSGWSASVEVRNLGGVDSRRVYLLFAVTGSLILLLACVNVASLLAARTSRRRSELALRAAIGASRLRLIGSITAESLLLAAAGCLLGLLIATGISRAVIAHQPFYLTMDKAPFSLPVLFAAGALAVLTAAAASVLPVLQGSRVSLVAALGDGSARSVGQGRRSPTNVLLAVQVAGSVVLLVGAGLMIATLFNISRVPLGFDPRDVAASRVTLDEARYPGVASRTAFYDRLLGELVATPGVQAASLASELPLSNVMAVYFALEGKAAPDPADTPTIAVNVVTPGYFKALRTPLLLGRDFVEREPEPVAIVNQAVARKYFAGENPLGRRIVLGAPPAPGAEQVGPGPRTIVAVVPNIGTAASRTTQWPAVYLPYAQNPLASMYAIARSSTPDAALQAIRRHVTSADAELPTYRAASLQQVVNSYYRQERFQALLLVVVASVALLISSIGLYASVAAAVDERTREVGVRLALGSSPWQAAWLVARRSFSVVAGGMVCGLVVAAAASRLLTSLLYGVDPLDPLTFTLASGLTVLVGAFATLIPARRAAALDPLMALRQG